jgi:biopolymer transport protein ExbD
MRFFLRKRKQTPTVIIVALIDVLIVLLIFLMVTTTFKQHPSLRLVLPESSQAQRTGDEGTMLVVSIDAKGTLRLGTEELPVTEERLKSELVSRVEKEPQLKLAINADKDAPFGQIIKVMDAAKEANIKRVNAFAREVAEP